MGFGPAHPGLFHPTVDHNFMATFGRTRASRIPFALQMGIIDHRLPLLQVTTGMVNDGELVIRGGQTQPPLWRILRYNNSFTY
jgi:hypothetical protein